jgi:hypothetical protein
MPEGSPARVLIVAVFLVFCPGAALLHVAGPFMARHGHKLDRLEVASLTVVLSLSLATLTAEAYYINQGFTTVRALGTLALVTSVAALVPRKGRIR